MNLVRKDKTLCFYGWWSLLFYETYEFSLSKSRTGRYTISTNPSHDPIRDNLSTSVELRYSLVKGPGLTNESRLSHIKITKDE